MSTLNKLPSGLPSPQYRCIAVSYDDPTKFKEAILTEWWNDNKQIESIEESANSYFYDIFDKSLFLIVSIEKV